MNDNDRYYAPCSMHDNIYVEYVCYDGIRIDMRHAACRICHTP